MRSPRMVPNLLRFRPRPIQRAARSLLTWSASPSRAKPRRSPERLGNLLQRLAHRRPALVRVVEDLVGEMLRQLDP